MPSLCILYRLLLFLGACALLVLAGIIVIKEIVIVLFWTEPMSFSWEAFELTIKQVVSTIWRVCEEYVALEWYVYP